MKLKRLFLLIVVVGLIAGGIYFFSPAHNQAATYYITETVKRGDIHQDVLATGSVRASQRTEIGAQVSGKIQHIYVTLGQAVKKGQLIAEIDSRTQRNSLNTAEAQLQSYQTQLKAKQTALDVAQSNFQRLSRLYQQKSASLTDLENAKNSLASAKANLEEITAQIKVAEINVNEAKTNLDYTQIVSPMDGVIVSIPVSIGQTVNANQTSPTIMQVADLSEMLIKLEIAEGDIAQVKTEQAVKFSTLSAPNRQYEGKINSLDPALTTLTDNNYAETSGNTSAVYYYANVLIPNQDSSLRIGMTVQGNIQIAERNNVLIVPSSVIKKKGKESVVSVLENNQAVEKTVKAGLSDGQFTEITEGLNEGENVIMTQRSEDEEVGTKMRPRF